MSHIDLESDSRDGGHLSALSNGSSCEAVFCGVKEADGGVALKWDEDPYNPYNWPTRYKIQQVMMMASAAFTASIGVSILSPAHFQIMEEFGVGSMVAVLPLSLYVLALGLGPLMGGPLSETVGRYPVYVGTLLLGSMFTVGVALSETFWAVCVLRFCAGFCFASSLAIAAGTINETFRPARRAIPSIIFVLAPFLGPGLGPVIGGFITDRKGWRWTQWTMLMFAAFTMVLTLFSRETFHPAIKRRRLKELGAGYASTLSTSVKLKEPTTITIFRPIQMLLFEPIVSFVSLYVACAFATLFTFFAATPLVFQGIYGFGIEDSGLVFLSVVVGCLFGTVTVVLCDICLYRRQSASYRGRQVPPELRLYPSLIGSIGLPVGLFWFGWTSRTGISWASPLVAMMLFAWGNLCVFLSTAQYIVDAYNGLTVASAMSANSLARYGLAAAFPLFTIPMYTRLGAGWASSLLGFIATALLPIPWILFTMGERIRAMSKFPTATL